MPAARYRFIPGSNDTVDYLVYILKAIPVAFLSAMELAMFLRAVFSWFMADGDNKFYNFLVGVTEPVITPVASVCERFGWVEESVMDMPFLITMVLISLLNALLTYFL